MKNNINEEKSKLSISLGYASQAGGSMLQWDGESADNSGPEISGDTAFSCSLPDGSRAVILSDGMGHGSGAAAESRAAAGLLRRLLKQGMPSARAIKEVNGYLLNRCSNRESFATVDLAVIEKMTGRAKFYKMGAAPSYIIRGRKIRKIQQPALPVGSLPAIRLSHVSARLAPGDIIVMMSDGICESGCRCRGSKLDSCCGQPEEDWLISYFNDSMASPLNLHGPRKLAAALLSEAQHRYKDTERDDATVIVIAIR